MKTKITKGMSRDEKEVLKANERMDNPTDRLGPASLLMMQSHINASRTVLANRHIAQHVSLKDPEYPLVPTGFENCLARYSHMIDESDGDFEIIKKFEKNPYTYVLIGFDKKRKLYHAWKREEAEEHSEGFSTKYNNKYIDSLEVGDTVPNGTIVRKSNSFDKNMNYRFGKNINVVYIVSPYVYEDGILAMGGVDKMFNTYRSHTIEINLADNEVLLNWYGDEKHYQGLPEVGEKTRKGFLGIVRRIDNTYAPYALKAKRLRHIERGDRKYYGFGRVVDIEIKTNKDPNKLLDIGATHQMVDMLKKQQKYYYDLYKYMQGLIDENDANDYGWQFSDMFTILCAEASDYVDASAYHADTNDTVYGNIKMTITLLDEEEMFVGSKFVGRCGNKGVIAKVLPEEESWKMEDGRPIHFAVAALGVVGRINHAQLNEHSITEMGTTCVNMMKQTTDVDKKLSYVVRLLEYLNPTEAKEYKKWVKNLSHSEKEAQCRKIEKRGITVFQEPIDNADILDIADAYEEFKPNYQRIVFPDGEKSMRKVLCAPMYYMRLKQDPLEKYSCRSKGPVNPLTTLPAKSNLKKKSMILHSDVAVRVGELEIEFLETMVNHPQIIADFMMENSTSFDAKMAISEQAYLGDLDEEINIDDIDIKGKKNIEWISAILNVLGTSFEIEIEEAPEGEYFDD